MNIKFNGEVYVKVLNIVSDTVQALKKLEM